MAQSLSFDIKIPEGQSVQITQDATFENFIGQFQAFCPKLMCVVDGTSLRYYDKKNTLPIDIRFDYKQRRGTLTEYYFRNINDDTLYCVFGREAASIFYPRIDEVDPSGAHELSYKTNSSLSNVPDLIQQKIGISSMPVIESQKSYNESSNMHSQPDLCKAKRPPIIQPIRQTSIPLFRETSQPKETQIRPTVTTRIIPNRSSIPDQIVIIDKGVKLSFPNPNYPIEVKTYIPA